MEKKLKLIIPWSNSPGVKKMLLYMKLTLVISLVAVLQTWAAVSYSQTTTLSINLKNASVQTVLQQIEDQSEFYFLYSRSVIDVDRTVDLLVRNAKITEVLNALFSESDVEYKVDGRQIVLSKKSENSSSEMQQQKSISGKVTDSTGGALPGVSVVIKGTTMGVITDANGDYSLSNIQPNATLQFSFVGMKKLEIAVGNRTTINVTMEEESIGIDEVVAIGYGTVKKSDLTGSVTSLKAEDFKSQAMSQVTEMLTGTIAGFNASQGTSAAGGAHSLQIRGPKSLSAGTDPLIVIDGAIFQGSLEDINPNDVQSMDVLKDASSAAIYGSKSASGVVIITTTKGKTGKPTINFSTKIGMSESYNQRRGLGPEAYIQYRKDFFRQVNQDQNFDYYTDPSQLPSTMTIDQWRELSDAPLADNTDEYLARLNFTDIEQKNYKAGKTIDWYDQVFHKGIKQEYDVSISGGTDNSSYFWSVGFDDNQGIRVGDEYASIRSRLNADFKIADWLNVGLNTQFAVKGTNSVPASAGSRWTYGFYVNSPYGQMFDENGNLERYPHGFYDNPLLDHYRVSVMDRTNSLFANMYASIKLPFGINFKVSYQPYIEASKYYSFTTNNQKFGGLPNEIPEGERHESSTMNWMVDNLLTWKKEIGVHSFDVTLLANMEENQHWYSYMTNKDFLPNQALSYHGLQYGTTPGIYNNDTRSTGDAYMARLNYILMKRYLLTATVRRDGFSAFGSKNPRATFPSLSLAWVVSDESFFKVDLINRLKMRLSWGVNGNRDIGIYSALAGTGSSLWYDGSSTRVGVYNSSLANAELMWERTASLNMGLDISLLKNRIDLTADYYNITTTNLLMNRTLPQVTGFQSIMSNLGELGNRGFEMTLNTRNISRPNFNWKSSLVFSLNRNKIKELFGDIGTYTLLGEEHTGELPDFSNLWFPGHALDAVWDYKITGIWQTNEATEAAKYGLEPGDYKVVDVNDDGKYVNLQDKKFIGYTTPRYHLGFKNDFTFLKNFTASCFIRAELGHIADYVGGTGAWGQGNQWNYNKGPEPYWTATRQNSEYPRLNTNIAVFGGGIATYKPASFVRLQDVSLTYNMPSALIQRIKMKNMQISGSVRNLVTITNWPGWDPESGMSPMPRTYTLGVNFSL